MKQTVWTLFITQIISDILKMQEFSICTTSVVMLPKCSQKDCIFQMLTHMPVTKSRLNSAMSFPLK
jgi:Predicted thioesterase